MKLLLVLLVIFSLLTTSCSPTKDSPTEYDVANRAVSEGQYALAIAIMKTKLESQPQDDRARVILSSAYAARAGVFLRDYLNYFELLNKELSLFNQALRKAKIEFQNVNPLQQENLQESKSLWEALQALRVLQKIESSLPRLVRSQEQDLARGLEALTPAKSLDQGEKIFRAFLRFLWIRSYIQLDILPPFQSECQISALTTAQALGQLYFQTRLFAEDLWASQNEEQSRARLFSQYSEISRALTSAQNNPYLKVPLSEGTFPNPLRSECQ